MPSPSVPPRGLARLDAEIAALVRRRAELVADRGEDSLHPGVDLSPASEVESLAAIAAQLGPAPSSGTTAESILRWLQVATEPPAATSAEMPPDDPEAEVLLIGGSGPWAAWLGRYLAATHGRVAGFAARGGSLPGPTLRYRVQDASLVVVTGAPRDALAAYREILKTETEALIVDALPVKAPLLPAIHRATETGLRVGSLSFLFPPSRLSLLGRGILVVDCGQPESTRAAHALVAGTAAHVGFTTLEAHDQLVGRAATLAFLLTLVRRAGELDGPWAGLTAEHGPESVRRAVGAAAPALDLAEEEALEWAAHGGFLVDALGRWEAELKELREGLRTGGAVAAKHWALGVRRLAAGPERTRGTPAVGGTPGNAPVAPGTGPGSGTSRGPASR
jgi:hypothetical protein